MVKEIGWKEKLQSFRKPTTFALESVPKMTFRALRNIRTPKNVKADVC